MNINENTTVIGRFHTTTNPTGLNIYNPYFQELDLNVVYLLFMNASPKPLVEGLRRLQIKGAITAGFEHDLILPKLADHETPAVSLCNRVGILVNDQGRITAHYQGGEGLLAAILEKQPLINKRVVLIGAGSVAKTFLLALEQQNILCSEIHIYNRTLENAQMLKDRFSLVTKVGSLQELKQSEGDVLINASRIGSDASSELIDASLVKRFQTVADVTFGVENTPLLQHAKEASLTIVSGWDMFTHQASVVLRHILNHKADINKLRRHVRHGLSLANHGKVARKV